MNRASLFTSTDRKRTAGRPMNAWLIAVIFVASKRLQSKWRGFTHVRKLRRECI